MSQAISLGDLMKIHEASHVIRKHLPVTNPSHPSYHGYGCMDAASLCSTILGLKGTDLVELIQALRLINSYVDNIARTEIPVTVSGTAAVLQPFARIATKEEDHEASDDRATR